MLLTLLNARQSWSWAKVSIWEYGFGPYRRLHYVKACEGNWEQWCRALGVQVGVVGEGVYIPHVGYPQLWDMANGRMWGVVHAYHYLNCCGGSCSPGTCCSYLSFIWLLAFVLHKGRRRILICFIPLSATLIIYKFRHWCELCHVTDTKQGAAVNLYLPCIPGFWSSWSAERSAAHAYK